MTQTIDAPAQQPSSAKRSRHQHLTQTSRGTPAGEMLRRYWQPIALISEVGSDPLPIRILGDDLVLFKDDLGRYGLLNRQCAHRCADLSLGRIEDGGLRCPYHGWLFDVAGRCLEQPAELSAGSKDRVPARSYPTHAAGGAVWAYLGLGEPPLFPDYPALSAPDPYRYTTRWFGDCNWLQASEGNIDPIHTSYLHQIELSNAEMKARWGVFSNNARPDLSIADTRFGIRLFTVRPLPGQDTASIRVTNFIMPNACAVGGFEGDLGPGGMTMLWDVPIDDEHHWRWEFIFHRSGRLAADHLHAQYASEKAPGDRMWRKKEDQYSQDRASMKAGSYIGLGPCFSVHDIVVTQSQGTIHEQNDEFLSSSDVAIVRARRLLDEATRDVAAGRDPRGVIRQDAENDFSDLVVITGELPAGTRKEDFVTAFTESGDLFQLEPLD